MGRGACQEGTRGPKYQPIINKVQKRESAGPKDLPRLSVGRTCLFSMNDLVQRALTQNKS